MKKLKLRPLFLIAVLLLSVAVEVMSPKPAAALSGMGYFTGSTGNWTEGFGGDVLYGREAGRNAIPAYATSSKDKFADFIIGRLNNGSKQDKTGAAFIINTMVQASEKDKTRNPSSKMRQDWRDRIMDDNIVMEHIFGNANSYGNGQVSFYDPVINDDFFANWDQGKRELLVFKNKTTGVIRYVVEIPCANPVGGLLGLPAVDQPPGDGGGGGDGGGNAGNCNPILLSVSVPVNYYGNKVGVTVTTSRWGKTYYNSGTYKDLTAYHTTGDVYSVRFSTPSYLINRIPIRDVNDRDKDGDTTEIIGYNNIYEPAHTWYSSIGPCYYYNLTPSVSVSPPQFESGNMNQTVRYGMSNTKDNHLPSVAPLIATGPSKTKPTRWELTEIIYAPEDAPISSTQKNARDNADRACSTFDSPATYLDCKVVKSGNQVIPAGGLPTATYIYNSEPDLEAGSQVCFALSVSKPRETAKPVWRHSSLQCMLVVKKPKFQVHGGDIRVNGQIKSHTSNLGVDGPGKVYGSWVEYGALATGSVSSFGSGSSLAGGSTNYNESAWHPLTFANTPSYGNFGTGTLSLNPSMIAQFETQSSSGTLSGAVNVANLSSGSYNAGSISISGTLGQDGRGVGKSVIIRSNGTVTITGDINYASPPGGFTEAYQIPQLVILANNINIRNSAGEINAWLITRPNGGAINTCSDVSTGARLTTRICDNRLTINGPIITSKIYLRRTAGAEDALRANNPSEVFNLRADAYLWAQRYTSATGKVQTVYTRELPPRF